MRLNTFIKGFFLSAFMVSHTSATEFQVEESTYDYLGHPKRVLTLTYTGKDTFTKISGYDASGIILNVSATSRKNVLVLLDDGPHDIEYYAGFLEGHHQRNPVFHYTTRQDNQTLCPRDNTVPSDFSLHYSMRVYDGVPARALTLRYTGAASFEGLAGYAPHKPLVNIQRDPTENIILLFESGPYCVTYYTSPDCEKWTDEYALFTYYTHD
ncbi:MAG: hypothetical protein H2057_01985 [Alphaproteobacteria bacterium]|nr:hypothetical protein [Alphaproteobacteria bacterium]